MRLLLLATFALVLSGCATPYQVDYELIADFEEPVVSEDQTGVYVIRGDNFYGAARGLWVALNDAVVADLSNSSHTFLEFDSGLNTIAFVQGMAGMGYLTFDNKPGEVFYVRFNYGAQSMSELAAIVEPDLGQTMVMKTKSLPPLDEQRPNDAYDNLLINPGMLDYPIMIDATDTVTPDAEHAVLTFYRPSKLADVAFDLWNQDGYVGSTTGGSYFSIKLKPGTHTFIACSEHYSVLIAEVEAGQEYAAEMDVGMGWNQAHIKLMPMNLNSNLHKQTATKWKSSLAAKMLNESVLENEAVATRIEMGHAFLDSKRTEIAAGEVSKRELPADFGIPGEQSVIE